MERRTKDLDQVTYIKNEEGKVSITEQDIKERWKSYLQNLFNEGNRTLFQSNRINTKDEDQNYTFNHRIRDFEVKKGFEMNR